ncbi:hypothetical protein, conserved [Trypanosoma brucei brucei TREU927]|uniref:Uncharacterized protein n=1 Tax=Trypanosoma brucei brucei (strain 927/4 GUTat10.1) TaxID=185431 RepID=Q57ZN4_TRYB2|nr:hypothetical protein, conserved [Trypanosoma brucei brucei TREU927]AAX79449.1 hypothetical protein, conserved [Trypanosoma brucei]AAZ10312.1 hypothetical protein, conserved [Trypanosoma brucei brucei TREU927]
MYVFSPAPQQKDPGGGVEVKVKSSDTGNGGQCSDAQWKVNFLSCLRGPAQTCRLLTCLSNTIVDVASGQTKVGKTANSEQKCISSSATDPVVQESYLTELCKYLAPEASSSDTGASTSAKNETSLLCVPKGEKGRMLYSTFLRMAEIPYWRQTLLGPLLRCWCSEGCDELGGTFLLEAIVNAIERELCSLNMLEQRHPIPEDASGGPELWDLSKYDKAEARQYEVLINELEGVVRGAGSFRGICIVMDCIIRNSIQRLVEGVHYVVCGMSARGGALPTGGVRMNEEVVRVVDSVVALVWREIGSFFQRCEVDVEAALSETQWLFLMLLITGYKGAHALLAAPPSVSSSSASSNTDTATTTTITDRIHLRARRMFFEKLQSNLRDYLSMRLLAGGDPASNSFASVHTVTCHQPFFWRCTLEAESAPGHLPPALSVNIVIKEWVKKEAATAWGNAVRVVRCFVHGQMAVEDVPLTAVPAVSESVISSIQRCHRQLVEQHIEHLSASQKYFFSAGKRPREDEGKHAMDGGSTWLSYMVEFFFCVYHPSCFSILSPVKQGEFVSLLRQLHDMILYKGHDALEGSIASLLPGEKASEVKLRDELMQWHTQYVHTRVVNALRENSFLVMCLLHGVFALFSRAGRTNIQGHEVLKCTLLPILSILCSPQGEGEGGEEDEEDVTAVEENATTDETDAFFVDRQERQQCMILLVTSGFMSIPWNLRGLRIRLLLFGILGTRLRDSFGSEGAASELYQLLSEVVSGQRTPEDIASEIFGDCTGDPFLSLLVSEREDTDGGTVVDAMEDILRRDVPVQFPAPCGTLLLMSVFRTLSQELLRLRTEWEQQIKLLSESESDYLGRQATFCTTEDIVVFRILVRVIHHMVFGFQVQPLGLLRLWISFLVHLFAFIVPPLTEDDELILLAPHVLERRLHKQQEDNDRKLNDSAGAISSSNFRRSANESSQGELRAALGELLADLVLMPLLDGEVAKQCPAAIPSHPGSRMWVKQNIRRSADILLLQRVLPAQVLEELCLALGVNVSAMNDKGPNGVRATRQVGGGVGKSFLGVLGVFAFCQRLDHFVVPGSVSDDGVALHLQALWHAVEVGYASSAV